MQKFQIEENIKTYVTSWEALQKMRNLNVSLSEKAKEFLVEVIDNIQQDPSSNWKTDEFNKNSAQELAISLIPNALNEIMLHRGPNHSGNNLSISISTWEIWHSMTPILKNWCFIPKDV